MPAMLQGMTREQAVMLLQKLQMQGYTAFPAPNPYAAPPNRYAAPAPSASGSYNVAAPSAASSTSTNNSGSSPEAHRNGFNSSSPINGVASAPQPQFADESLKVRRDDDGPFGYEPPSAWGSSRGNTSSSFSPFSPDPNQKTQAQQEQQGMGGLYAYGGGGFAGSPPAFQINRYQSSAQTQPISRPKSGSARERENRREQFDAMLDETLARRDLDREFAIGERTWGLKSPTITESTSSGGACRKSERWEGRVGLGVDLTRPDPVAVCTWKGPGPAMPIAVTTPASI
ncbi:hypothetical protein B0H14DRAFT_3745888 [Mycena olivaceomarginata]|nr:hypothetical protein B0H14DRAFT_3745888 [Mycena olivaceomarginata]